MNKNHLTAREKSLFTVDTDHLFVDTPTRNYKYTLISKSTGLIDIKTGWIEIPPHKMAKRHPNHFMKYRKKEIKNDKEPQAQDW
jgi:hypothetical protein